MLIESAKDCLRFSVTHYKHPKQPHTVQVCKTFPIENCLAELFVLLLQFGFCYF